MNDEELYVEQSGQLLVNYFIHYSWSIIHGVELHGNMCHLHS